MISFLYNLSGSDKFCKFKQMVAHEIYCVRKGFSLLYRVCVHAYMCVRRCKIDEIQEKIIEKKFLCIYILSVITHEKHNGGKKDYF